jgi:hypothetical protein
MTEQQFANTILEWAKQFGWLAFHVRNSGYGNVSQVQGDKGFPDLIMAKAGRVIAAELKVEKAGTVRGDPRPEQQRWLSALGTRMETYVWRPEDLVRAVNLLRGVQ